MQTESKTTIFSCTRSLGITSSWIVIFRCSNANGRMTIGYEFLVIQPEEILKAIKEREIRSQNRVFLSRSS